MPSPYEIERSEPTRSRCGDCGGLTVQLTRFVRRDGDAHAVYYARYSNDHPDAEVAVLVSIGAWDEGAPPADRRAFYGRVRPMEGEPGVRLEDAATSPWADVARLGRMLSRAEALAHPDKAEAFAILDAGFKRDPSLRGFLARAACSDPKRPLEFGFGAPDDVFALGRAAGDRVDRTEAMIVLDRRRFFVRCLVPVPVEGYGDWSVGAWIEIGGDDYLRIADAWDDREAYPALRFRGRLANEGRREPGLPLPIGAEVEVAVADPDQPPHVVDASDPALHGLLTRAWSRDEFEAYAVARGFL